MDIRHRLRTNRLALREAKGWSQEALADEAGIHRTYGSNIERGARNPTIELVDRLANPLGTKIGKLLDWRARRL